VYIVVSLALGAVHLVLLLPLPALRSELVWRLADLERKAANRFLRTHLPRLPADRAPERPILALLALRLPTAAAAAVIGALPAALTIVLIVYGAKGLAGGRGDYLGPWSLNPLMGFVLWVFALRPGS
jgi:hypothetical protein